MKKNRLIDKKVAKKIHGKCKLCDEATYELLDVHRIIPGEQGGRYTDDNTVVLCSKCHRKVHAGLVEIDRWYQSTGGRLLRVIEAGIEKFL